MNLQSNVVPMTPAISVAPMIEPDVAWVMRELRDRLFLEVADVMHIDIDAAQAKAARLWCDGVFSFDDLQRIKDLLDVVQRCPRQEGEDG